MLPDFVSLKRLFDVALTSFDHAQHSKDPILSVFPVVRHFEGDKLTKYPIGSRPNEPRQVEYASYSDFSSRYQTSVERMIALGHLESIEAIKSMTAQIQAQAQHKVVLDLDNTATETGQRLKRTRIPVDFEDHMSLLEKLPISFDANGLPHLPQMLTSAGVQRLDERVTEWLDDEERKAKYEQLIRQKRKEWDDREGDRKLVD